MIPPPPMPPPVGPVRARRRPALVRVLLLVLLASLAAEIALIARHYGATAPVRSGIRAAARAERRLGAGPLGPRATRLDYARLDQRLQQLMARRDQVGLGIAVVEDGQLAFIKTYGETLAGSGEKVTPQTQFRWASLSKGVAATLEEILADRHELSLDDPIARWSGSLKLPHDNQKVATLADALSHRLGIVKNAYDDRLEDNEDPAAIRGLYGSLYPMCPPGTCWAYQNVAFDVAHEVVEKALGESYDSAARRLLFDPLGMTSASTTRQGLIGAKSWARPHDGRRPVPVQEAYFRVPAAGGVSSSIVDLGIWMRAQMGGAPAVLPQRLLWQLHVPRVRTDRRGNADYDLALRNSSYGLGFRESDYEGHHLVWHRGAVRGSRSQIIFDPVERFGVALLWNSSSVKPTGLPFELLDQYYRRPFRDWLQPGRP